MQAWAAALDREAFDELPALLSRDCVYLSPKGELRGDAIIASYRDNAAWAHATFDRIAWDSELVMDTGTSARITFIDTTDHQGQHHVYRCQQRVHVNAAGLIDRIEHVAIPAEEDALAAFFERVGVKR